MKIKMKHVIATAALSFCSISAMATVPVIHPEAINQTTDGKPSAQRSGHQAHAHKASKPESHRGHHSGTQRGKKGSEPARQNADAPKHGHKHGHKDQGQRAERPSAHHSARANQHQARFEPKFGSNRHSERRHGSHFVWVED